MSEEIDLTPLKEAVDRYVAMGVGLNELRAAFERIKVLIDDAGPDCE